MEVPHEEIVGDLSHIVKGKRTKRLRPQSPIPFTITSHSSTRIDGHDDPDGDVLVHGEVTIINDDNNNNNDNNNDSSTPPPPATSADNFPPDDVITEEEEETAKCLILLSQGGQPYRRSPDKSFKLFNDDMGLPIQSKFNSKKYIETTNIANGGGKVGTYVYECKTCNRTFSSFQALGGHRASHKKPKPLSLEPKKPFYYFSDQDEPSPTTTTTTYKNNNNNNNNNNVKLSPLSPLSFQFNNINMESPTNKSSPRIHTCSYCGAEFNSGQALGGHMRRHRGGANTNLCLSPLSSITPTISLDEFGYNNNNFKKPRNNYNNNIGLSLDLNLPAPEDQSHQSRNLQQEDQEQQQQQHEDQSTALVLSTTPQLIDCHY